MTKKIIVVGSESITPEIVGAGTITPEIVAAVHQQHDMNDIVIITSDDALHQGISIPDLKLSQIEEMSITPDPIYFEDDILRKEAKFRKQQNKYRARFYKK